VVDVNILFEREPAQSIEVNPSILVRDIQSSDEDSVLKIAETAFVYSRFHLDPNITKKLADNIKREWIDSYLKKRRGERLLIAEVDNQPIGFLALLSTGENKTTGVIDLIGVAKNMRGRGVGKSLVKYHIQDGYGKYSNLIVGTQISNIPSMRLYMQCGYDISNSYYVLHAHIRKGRIIR